MILVALGLGWARAQDTAAAAPQQAAVSAKNENELDRDVKELRFAELEERLKTQPPSVERSYLKGSLPIDQVISQHRSNCWNKPFHS